MCLTLIVRGGGFRSRFSMTTNDVFCFVLVRIDLFQWATLLFQPFWPDIWPHRVQNGQKRPFWAISGAGGSKLVEQCGTRVEQVRAHPWCCIGTVLGVREGHVGVPEGSQKGPKRPKTAFLGHKQIWWLQTDGTVWNKGGSSQGTSPVMHWNSFAGQGGPSRGTRGLPKGSKTAKNSLFRP